MNNFLKLSVLTFLSIVCINCGNADAPNSAAANANSANAATQANNIAATNAPQMQPAFNGETKTVANGIAIPANEELKVVEADKNSVRKNESPAADDSTFSIEMNGKGQPVETRTFRSHPQLAKIEKITLSTRDYVYKVYLKNGKVVESKSEDLKDFRFIAPVNILDAIGMKQPPPKPDPNAPRKVDKSAPVLIPKAEPQN